MSDRLLVGTKKGLFELRRTRGTWSIAGARFLGDPISMLLDDPRDGALYAAEALGHFGVSCSARAMVARSGGKSRRPRFPRVEPTSRACLNLFCLETADTHHPGRLLCGTIPGALFLSKDHGEYWALNEPPWNLPHRKDWMGGGFDDADVASISVDPHRSDHMTIGASTGGVWITEDAGHLPPIVVCASADPP